MAALLTTLDSILKTRYEGGVNEAIYEQSVARSVAKKNTDDVDGRTINFCLHTRRNSGVAFGTESGSAPAAGQQGYVQPSAQHGKKLWGRFQISVEIVKKTKSGAGAFARAMQREMDGLKDDILIQEEKHFHMDGTGVFATIPGAFGASATQQVSSTRFLEVGNVLDFRTAAGALLAGSPAAGTAIISIDETVSPATITVADVVTTTGVTNTISLRDSISAGPVSNTISGLLNLIDDTTLYGVNPATEPAWSSLTRTVAAAPDTTEAQIERILDDCHQRFGAKNLPTQIFTAFNAQRQFKAGLVSQRQQVNTLEVRAGRLALAINYGMKQVPLIPSKYNETGRLIGINDKHLVYWENQPFGWFDLDGHILQRTSGAQTLVEGLMYGLGEFGIKNRFGSFNVDGFSTAG